MRYVVAFFMLASLLTVATAPARAGDNRYLLASQYDWAAKRGFYLDLENSTAGAAPCRLPDMKLALGVADGNDWSFSILTHDWQPNHLYTVSATIGSHVSQVAVDGGTPSTIDGGFDPNPSAMTSHDAPDWALAPADYRVAELRLEMRISDRGTSSTLTQSWTIDDDRSRSLAALSGQAAVPFTTPLRISTSAIVTLRVTFELLPQSGDPAEDLRSLSPLIDRYGQAVAADWPGKVTTDADVADEKPGKYRLWNGPANRDAYGGATDAGWTGSAKGYYSLLKHSGRWWLITPNGNPCFYVGADTAPDLIGSGTPVTGRAFVFADLPPRDGPYAATWLKNVWGDAANHEYVSLSAGNLIRKYGADWKAKAAESTARRLETWGFTGMGKWSAPRDVLTASIPYTPVLEHGDVPNLAGHPDIFDPTVQAELRESLRTQIQAHVTDPDIVAWSVGNEYDEIITPDEIKKIVVMPDTVPARRALFTYAQKDLYHGDADALHAAWKMGSGPPQLPDTDVEALRQYYEARYYEFLYRTVKALDPHHLYAGYWPSIGWWVGPQDWRIVAPYCDVIGYDRYDPLFADPDFQKLIDQTDKPILCGEFSFPPYFNGRRGFGKYPVAAVDDADAGRLYARWVTAAAAEPHCVGVCWFEYRDEPISGRGPGEGPQATIGEHYAFGLVDDTDRPKWDLVSAVRAANFQAVSERLKH